MGKLLHMERMNMWPVVMFGVKYLTIPWIFWGFATTGVLVNDPLLFSWIMLLPLGTLLAAPVGFIVDYVKNQEYKNQDTFGARLKAAGTGVATRVAAVGIRAMVATIILMVMLLLVLNTYVSHGVWVSVMGNHVLGHGGNGFMSFVILVIWSFVMWFAYYELLASIANVQRSFIVHPPLAKKPLIERQPSEGVATVKAIVLAIIVPLLFMLPIGLNVVHNMGA